jgi:stage V sporulation protein G
MQVTEVKVRKLEEGNLSRAIAIASVVLDDEININDIKLTVDRNSDFFIMMPSKKMPNGEFKDIAHPIKSEAREKITKAIIEEYNKIQ